MSKAERKERSRELRLRRAERYDSLFAPSSLAIAGALASLAFLFQTQLVLKLALFAAFLIAALASGKRVSLLTTLFVSLGIVVANLLVPVGRVLWRAGPLAITETALLDGIAKAVTFEGLIYISKASIRPGLRLPGRFGSIVASAFVYYDRIVEYRGQIHAATLLKDADALMLEVWEKGDAQDAPPKPGREKQSGPGLIALITVVVVSFTLLALSRI
jgi:hypothetical protein